MQKLETDLHTTRSELQLLQHRQGHCEQEKQDLENRISTLQGLVHRSGSDQQCNGTHVHPLYMAKYKMSAVINNQLRSSSL